jgi:preprotein translocase subunit SecD
MNLKSRLALIGLLILASVWALYPRTTVERVKRNGVFVYDTVKRVPLKKGLDLEGGMYLALEVDESKGRVDDKKGALERALKVVRTRIDQFGVSEPVVQLAGNDRIIVELPGIDDPDRAQAVVQKSAFLEFQINDETQALERVVPRIDAVLKDPAVLAGAGAVAEQAKPATTSDSAAGITSLFQTDSAKKDSAVKDTAVTTPGTFSKLLQQGNVPGQFYVAEKDVNTMERYLSLPQVQAVLPPGKVLRWSGDTTSLGNQTFRALYVLDALPILTGVDLTDAKPNTSPTEGTLVEFQLNREGGRRFQNQTSKHIKDYMSIVLDQRVMSTAVIQSAIASRGQITMGGRDLQAAQDLALVLRAGALPVPLKVAEVREIGASLGKDSIDKGMTAGIIAVVLVIVIMIGYYRFSGMLAVGGLVLYVLFTFAVLASFGAVLTLPGLAGFVLSIGIAVDANVLIFERIREELDHGKSVRLAIDEGFRHAMSAIVDSNVATALTAAVLYQYGTGPVRGFAVTLLAGIAASMMTSIFVVRTFYMIWLSRSNRAEALSI